MSVEGILLLVLFVVLPLLQQLFESSRRKQERPAPPKKQRPPGPRPRPTARVPVPVPAAAEVLTEITGNALSEEVNARIRRSLQAATPPSVVVAHRRARGRSGVPAGLRNPRELRRAMVLSTILGPCRAVAPHAWPEA